MPKTLREEFPSVLDIAYLDYGKSQHVSGIMSIDVKMIDENKTMMDAAREMGKYHIGSLLVSGPEWPAGIVTERDLLTRIIAAGKNPKTVKVFDAMSPRIITIRPQSTVKEAAQTMIREKGRLVVFDGRNLMGIVAASDFIKSMPDSPETAVPVSKFMTKVVATVSPHSKVLKVAKKMGKERIGSVILVKNGKPWGIFTERDLLSKVIQNEKMLGKEVGEFSSSPLVMVEPEISIHKAAAVMVKKHVRRLPVFKNGKMVGIITARDLVEAYAL